MEFGRRFERAAGADIDAFAAERGIEVPQPLRDFLASEGGGTGPHRDTVASDNLGETYVDTLFGFETADDAMIGTRLVHRNSVRETDWGNFSEEVERQILPVARAEGGDVFVVDCRPQSFGRVYLRAHDKPLNDPPLIDVTGFDDEDREEARLYHPVAASFDAFLGMLVVPPPDEDEDQDEDEEEGG